MKILKATLLGAAIVIALGACAGTVTTDKSGTRSVETAIDDATITGSVKSKLLADERTQGFDINVDTKQGIVTLRGGADSQAAKLVAGRLAGEELSYSDEVERTYGVRPAAAEASNRSRSAPSAAARFSSSAAFMLMYSASEPAATIAALTSSTCASAARKSRWTPSICLAPWICTYPPTCLKTWSARWRCRLLRPTCPGRGWPARS